MGIFGDIIAPTKAVLNQLFADPALRETVTYKRFDSSAFDETVGHNVTLYTDTELYAIRLKHNARSAAVSNARVQVGDDLLMFRADDVPDNMSLKDLIVDGTGAVLKLRGIDDIFDLAISVTVDIGGEIS